MENMRSISLLLIFISIIPTAYGRWATINDLDTYIESYNKNIYVRKDGTYVETTELTMVATKESGKDKLVTFPLVYNAASDELKVLEAKTIVNGAEYPVDLTHIEDKPLASSPQGFDQKHQILVAFPDMALNAKIYLKYQTTVKQVPITGFFATDFVYGSDTYWQSSRVQVDSELPFYIAVQDSERCLDIRQKKINAHYHLDIQLKKPIIKVPVNEKYMAVDVKTLPWVSLSTVQEWPKLGSMLISQYEAVVNQPLPPLLEKIRLEAQTKQTVIEKINTITARLAENITYMGDWRTIKGAYIPRSLAEIVKTKLGDCKDFSAMTVAILRKMGIKANPALVNRGSIAEDRSGFLPNLGIFNHAFVTVQDNKQCLWIDPTNFSSFAQGIYPDIANREALVLDPRGPALLKTKALTEQASKVQMITEVDLPTEAFDVAHVKCKLSLSGIFALPLVGADLRLSKESINRGILSAVTDESHVVQWNMGDYNLTSRIASDLTFNFDFTEKNTQMKTTAGKAFLWPAHWQTAKLLAKIDDRVTDLLLGEPGTYHYEMFLPKKSLVGENIACSVECPWFSGTRKITNTPNGIQVIEELIIKKERILNNELKSKAYADLQKNIFTCFGDTALVYQHNIKSHCPLPIMVLEVIKEKITHLRKSWGEAGD